MVKKAIETKEAAKTVEFPQVNFNPTDENRPTFDLTFTDIELENLIKLMDIATKAAGLEVAKVTVNLTDKIMAAVQEQK